MPCRFVPAFLPVTPASNPASPIQPIVVIPTVTLSRVLHLLPKGPLNLCKATHPVPLENHFYRQSNISSYSSLLSELLLLLLREAGWTRDVDAHGLVSASALSQQLWSIKWFRDWNICHKKGVWASWHYLVWRRLRGYLISVYKYLTRNSTESRLKLFSPVVSVMK